MYHNVWDGLYTAGGCEHSLPPPGFVQPPPPPSPQSFPRVKSLISRQAKCLPIIACEKCRNLEKWRQRDWQEVTEERRRRKKVRDGKSQTFFGENWIEKRTNGHNNDYVKPYNIVAKVVASAQLW